MILLLRMLKIVMRMNGLSYNQVFELVEESNEPKKKKVRKNITLADRYEVFLQKSVVRGKVVKVSYFQEQGLGVFVGTLEA